MEASFQLLPATVNANLEEIAPDLFRISVYVPEEIPDEKVELYAVKNR